MITDLIYTLCIKFQSHHDLLNCVEKCNNNHGVKVIDCMFTSNCLPIRNRYKELTTCLDQTKKRKGYTFPFLTINFLFLSSSNQIGNNYIVFKTIQDEMGY